MQLLGRLPAKVEFVCVDDGSRDKTWDTILDMTKKYAENNFD